MVSRDPEAHSENRWQGGKNGDLKRSSGKWTAQQDSTCAQGSLHGSHHQPGEEDTSLGIFKVLEAGAVSWTAEPGSWTPLTGLLPSPWGSV